MQSSLQSQQSLQGHNLQELANRKQVFCIMTVTLILTKHPSFFKDKMRIFRGVRELFKQFTYMLQSKNTHIRHVRVLRSLGKSTRFQLRIKMQEDEDCIPEAAVSAAVAVPTSIHTPLYSRHCRALQSWNAVLVLITSLAGRQESHI